MESLMGLMAAGAVFVGILPIIHAARAGDAMLTFGVIGIIIAAGAMAFAGGLGSQAAAAIIWAAAYLGAVFADFTVGATNRRAEKEAREVARRLKSAPPPGESQRAPKRPAGVPPPEQW